MPRVKLDTVNPSDAEFQSSLRDLGIDSHIIQHAGPAGGNPLVEYVGMYESLIQLIDRHFSGGDEAEARNLKGRITGS